MSTGVQLPFLANCSQPVFTSLVESLSTNYSSLPRVPQAISCLKHMPIDLTLRDSMLFEVTESLSKLYVYSDIVHNASFDAPQLPERYAGTVTVHDVAIDTYDPLWQSAGIPYDLLLKDMESATTMYDFWDPMNWLMFRLSDAHSYVTVPYEDRENGIRYSSFPPLPLVPDGSLDASGKQTFSVKGTWHAAYDPSAQVHFGKTVSKVNGEPVSDYLKKVVAAGSFDKSAGARLNRKFQTGALDLRRGFPPDEGAMSVEFADGSTYTGTWSAVLTCENPPQNPAKKSFFVGPDGSFKCPSSSTGAMLSALWNTPRPMYTLLEEVISAASTGVVPSSRRELTTAEDAHPASPAPAVEQMPKLTPERDLGARGGDSTPGGHAARKLSPQPYEVNITEKTTTLDDGTAITLYESPGNAVTYVIRTVFPDGTATVSFKITSFEFNGDTPITSQAHAQLAVNLASEYANGELILDTIGNGGGAVVAASWFQQFFFGGISKDFQPLVSATQWINRRTNSQLLQGQAQAREVVAAYNEVYNGLNTSTVLGLAPGGVPAVAARLTALFETFDTILKRPQYNSNAEALLNLDFVTRLNTVLIPAFGAKDALLFNTIFETAANMYRVGECLLGNTGTPAFLAPFVSSMLPGDAPCGLFLYLTQYTQAVFNAQSQPDTPVSLMDKTFANPNAPTPLAVGKILDGGFYGPLASVVGAVAYPTTATPGVVPFSRDWYTAQVKETLGGRLGTYTGIIKAAGDPAPVLGSGITPPAFLDVWTAPSVPQTQVTKFKVLTDGTCGSACSHFISRAVLTGAATAVSYGGFQGETFDISSFGGSNVLEWDKVWPYYFLSLYGMSVVRPDRPPVDVFSPLPVAGGTRFTLEGTKHPDILGPSSLYREFYNIPATYHLDVWSYPHDLTKPPKIGSRRLSSDPAAAAAAGAWQMFASLYKETAARPVAGTYPLPLKNDPPPAPQPQGGPYFTQAETFGVAIGMVFAVLALFALIFLICGGPALYGNAKTKRPVSTNDVQLTQHNAAT